MSGVVIDTGHAGQASAQFSLYRALEESLRHARERQPVDEAIEGAILEEMTHVWWTLTQGERDMLDAEGVTCAPNHRER